MTMTGSAPLSPPPVPTDRPRRWRDMALLAGLIVLVVAGLSGLAAATGWSEVRAQLARLAPGQVVILLALAFVNYLFRGLRWHLFSRRLGLGLPMTRSLLHFFGGFAMSVTPGRVGELVRMRWIRRETGWPFARTAPLVLVDRAADLAAMAVLLGLSVALSTGSTMGALPIAALALVTAVVVTRPRLLSRLAGLGHHLTGGRWPRLFARVRAAARSLRRFSSPAVMLGAAALGLVGWSAEGWSFHLLLNILGADISLPQAVAIFTFATLAGGLTGAPGGVGGAEAAMVALLTLDGVPLETAVPATAVIRLTTLWFAILIGLIAFPVAERSSARRVRAA